MKTTDDDVLLCEKKITIPEFQKYTWDEFINLKFKNNPDYLYKFYSNNQYCIDAIQYGTVHLTKASVFNDPFDCSLRIDNEKIRERYFDLFAKSVGCKFHKPKDIHQKISILYDHLDKSTSYLKAVNAIANNKDINVDEIKRSMILLLDGCYSEKKLKDKRTYIQNLEKILDSIVKNGFSDLLQQQKICCFSIDNDSQLMWSHYASSHKGICVKYKYPFIKSYIDLQRLSDTNRIIWKHILPVAYMHKRVDTTENLKLFLQDVLDIEKQSSIYKFGYLSKSWDWRYEKEWRFIFPYSNIAYHPNHPLSDLMCPNDNIKFLPISAVYMGCKMEPEERDKVIEAAVKNAKMNNSKIDIWQGKESKTEYKIIFDKIKTVG